jgi:hypothetical protein
MKIEFVYKIGDFYAGSAIEVARFRISFFQRRRWALN